MWVALGSGALSASSLVVGALLGLARQWSVRLIGLVLAFGAGALISAVSFELFEEGAAEGSVQSVALGLAAGGLVYFLLDDLIERIGNSGGNDDEDGHGAALALGAFLDGIPEQAVLGIGLGSGKGVSDALLVAIFVSNLPESIGSASELRGEGRSRRFILRLWIAVAVVCWLATPLGYGAADVTSGDLKAIINGFAAGALLVMLVDSMIPEATAKARRPAGLATVLGFSLAAGLSSVPRSTEES
jgi:ZIP family zinc transporter